MAAPARRSLGDGDLEETWGDEVRIEPEADFGLVYFKGYAHRQDALEPIDL